MAVKLSTNRLMGSYAPVLGLVVVTAVMVLGHAGGLLNYAFPIMAAGLAFFLFRVRQNIYVAFVWWIWLFSPLVRRLADFQSGYHVVSPVMLSPLLVTLVAAIPLLRRPRFILRREYLPFLFIFFVYIDALIVGAVENGFGPALFDFANSTLPLAFGLFLMNDPKRFQENRESLIFAIVLGLLLISLYGLYQFYHMPPWDAFWLQSSKFGSAGSGLAEQTRLFGTLNSPGPYAMVLMASLVFVLVVRGSLKFLAAGFGFPAFGLSLVRSDWGGWVLAAVFVALCIGGKTRLRMILFGFVAVLIAYPLVMVGPVADQLSKRLATFNNIQHDNSYQARQHLYETFTSEAFSQPIGNGFGSNGQGTKLSATGASGAPDSGVLQVPYEYGWVFGGIFTWAVLMTCLRVFSRAIKTSDAISIAGAAVFLVMVLENLAAPMFGNVNGMATWAAFAIAVGPYIAPAAIKSGWRKDAGSGTASARGLAHGN